MKRICKLSVLLAFVILLLTSCHQEKPVGTPHRARYELISKDGTPLNMGLNYVTQTGIGIGQGIESKEETVITPWNHEFTIYGSFQFLIICNDKEENINDRKPFVARIYLDDNLIAEQESDQFYSIYLSHFYKE